MLSRARTEADRLDRSASIRGSKDRFRRRLALGVVTAMTAILAGAGGMVTATSAAAVPDGAVVVPPGTLQPIDTGYIVNGNVLSFGNGLEICDSTPDPGAIGTCDQLHTGQNANNFVMMRYVDVDDDPSTFNSSTATVTIPSGAVAARAWLMWSADGYAPGQDPAVTDCAGGGPRDPDHNAPVRSQVSVDQIMDSTPVLSIDGAAYGSVGSADYVATLNERTHAAADVTPLLKGMAAGTHRITVGNVVGSQGYACAVGWSIHLSYDYGSFDPGNLDTSARAVYTSFGIDSVFGSANPRSLVFSGFKTTVPGANFLITTTEGDSNGGGQSYDRDTAEVQWAGGSAPVTSALGQVTNIFRSYATGQVSFAPGVPDASFFNGSVDTFPDAIPGVPVGTTEVTLVYRSGGAEGYAPQAVTLAVPVGAIRIDKTAATGLDGQVLVPGDTPNYHLKVSNAGAVPLQNVVVADPLAVACSLDGTPLTRTDAGFQVGDLAVQDTALLVCTGSPLAGGAVGFVNTATATAQDPNGDSVTPATDDSTVFVGGITLSKTAQQPVVPVGADETWLMEVRNTGDAPLHDVALTDDDCSGTLSAPQGAGAETGVLQPGDSWTYTCTEPLTEGKTNTASVTATPIAVVDGENITGPQVNAQDDASASVAGFTIKKYTNGEDADEAPGPFVNVGDPVQWTYEVKNIGEVGITDVVVVDDQGVTVPGTPSTGDTDNDGILDPGEVWTFVASGTATAGQYGNVGTVSGTFDSDLDPATPPVPLTPVSDPSHYFGQAPAIELVKTGQLTGGGQVGETIDYSFMATNTGNVLLTDVVISDPHPGLSELKYDWPGKAGQLKPGESVTATAKYQLTSADVAAGKVLNAATVTGTPPRGEPVTDDANAVVSLPAVPGGSGLASTGGGDLTPVAATAAAVLLLGALFLVIANRRKSRRS